MNLLSAVRLTAAGLGVLAMLAAQEPRKQAPLAATNVPRTLEPSALPKAALPARDLAPEKYGDLMMVRKRYREAVDVYLEAIESLPGLLTKIGYAHHELNQLEPAKEHYEMALREEPRHVQALNNLGAVYYDEGDYKKAEHYYRVALAESPQQALIHGNLGTALLARRKYSDATGSFERALQLDPAVFTSEPQGDELLQSRQAGDKPRFHYFLSKAYEEVGMEEKAEVHLQQAIEGGLDPEKAEQETGGGFWNWLTGLFR